MIVLLPPQIHCLRAEQQAVENMCEFVFVFSSLTAGLQS